MPACRRGDNITLQGVADSERVERFWPTRLRWRMRGAWLWPTFLVLTPVEGILLSALPPYGSGPEGIVGGMLLAGFANLFLIAVVAPLVGLALRRRRRDLPRLIATDLCGTALLCVLAVGILAAGLAHRPAAAAQERDLASAYAAVHDYVLARAPEYRSGLAAVDALRLREDAYRVCVPGHATDRWLCLLVDTDVEPVALRRDASMEPNSTLRTVGGFH
jgi:hypothetical protein